MKITIKYDDDNKQEAQELTLSNDDLDNLNYIDLHIGKENGFVVVEELFAAVQAFMKARELNWDREQKYAEKESI
jgi:hypothetical protein